MWVYPYGVLEERTYDEGIRRPFISDFKRNVQSQSSYTSTAHPFSIYSIDTPLSITTILHTVNRLCVYAAFVLKESLFAYHTIVPCFTEELKVTVMGPCDDQANHDVAGPLTFWLIYIKAISKNHKGLQMLTRRIKKVSSKLVSLKM